MAYQALYRKFRPKDFDEVRGQEHIVTTLKNQLKAGRIGHAYVFSGTRGTGKTSIAKIFAKALNCESPIDGNPCGACSSCKKIAEGSSLNVFEVDGASNNGVENVRTIIDDLSYPPVEGKSKVYIIDEAHMVTQQAFNALLKTIEEPPEYVVFILATTEVNKIPLTILSRCQRYDFHRITVETISSRIKELCDKEGILIQDRAINYIARMADGSMRDSLSILDQCISYYYNQEITFDMTLDMLGAADNDIYSALFRAVSSHDATKTLKIIDEVLLKGKEPETFVSGFTWYLRNMLLVKNGEKLEDVADISTNDTKLFMEELDLVSNQVLMHYITVLSGLVADIKLAPIKRITTEIGLVRLCRPQMSSDTDALVARIEMLEKQMNDGALSAPRQVLPQVQVKAQPQIPVDDRPWDEEPPIPWDEEPPLYEESIQEKEPQIPAEDLEDIKEPQASVKGEYTKHTATTSTGGVGLAAVWQDYLYTVPMMDRSMILKAVPVSDSDNQVTLFFVDTSIGGKFYSKEENIANLRNSMESFLGHPVELSIKTVSEDQMPGEGDKEAPQTTATGAMGGEDFLKKAELCGVTIEIEE